MCFLSCSKELQESTAAEDRIDGAAPIPCEFTVVLPGEESPSGEPSVKTALAPKSGNAWPNYWAAGDAVFVNGSVSNSLAENSPYIGTNTAVFSIPETPAAPYCYAYPASSFSQYSEGSATFILPSVQSWSADTYDASAFVMIGSGNLSTLQLNPMMAAVRLTVPGNYASGKWASVRFESLGSEKVSGAFSTDFSAIEGDLSAANSVLANAPEGGAAWGTSVFLLIPAQTYARGLRFIITAMDGTKMTYSTSSSFTAVAGKVYPLTTTPYNPDPAETEGITLTSLSHSSSTLSFTWTEGGSVAEDIAQPYTVELYRDAACTDRVVAFEIEASHSCWNNKRPAFVFSGLLSGTTYWCKVHDTQAGKVSAAVSATTDAFTPVDATTVSDAGVGDVILAEDFSEIGWSTDEFAVAAGFHPGIRRLEPLSGTHTSVNDGTFREYNSTAVRLYGVTTVASDKRLYHWGFFGNSSVYAFAGYLRVGSTSNGARTHIVSPALAGIPAGQYATVDVTVTSCKNENNDNDVAVFIQDHRNLTLKLAPDQTTSTSPAFSSNGGKYTGATLTNGYGLDALSREWTTRTLRITGITSNDCLIIGSLSNVDTKNRFCLNDVTARIVSLSTEAPVIASLGRASSSTLSFTWTKGGSAADDVACPYTIGLYRDAACTDAVVTYDIPAGDACWNNKQPRFVFGGLNASTTYYFKVVDTTNGGQNVSNTVSGKTSAFQTVTLPSSVTQTGVILAEDFSELLWDFDYVDGAAGFRPSSKNRFSNRDAASFAKTGSSGEITFAGQTSALPVSRLSGWATDSNVYLHPGFLKLGTASAKGWILTPQIPVPEGKVATVRITLTGARYSGASDTWAVAVLTPSQANVNGYKADFSWPEKVDGEHVSTNYQTATFTSSTSWATQTISGLQVYPGDRIVFGCVDSADASKSRCFLSDITIEVLVVGDAVHTQKVSILGDSISTFKGWCDVTTVDGKTSSMHYPKPGVEKYDVNTVGDTWWYKVIYDKMSTGIFEKNISAGNTTVVQNTTGDSSAAWYGWDFGTRIQKLGLGNPDIVFIFGGTNDYGHTLYNSTSEELIDGVAMGAESFPSSSASRLNALLSTADAATTVSAADALDGTTFCSAYIRLIRMIQVRYPSVKIVCVIGDYLYYGMGEAIRRIVAHYDSSQVRAVDILGEVGFHANTVIPKAQYAHPTAAGMEYMATFVYNKVGAWLDE